MLTVANPLYDTAFKYLMEDLEVAKTFIGALLRKEVKEVVMRRNEYSNIQKQGISIFRIDFGATVLDKQGNEQHVLIELQKAWVETEILRFRQYLAAQYGNPDNIYDTKDKADPYYGHGIPIVSVYILGHCIGSIEEPIVYVSRNYLNYENEPITEGCPNPFIESLTHDSVVVQIPLLKGRMRNQLEQVLDVFDQSRRNRNDRRMVDLDETRYADMPGMKRIVNRLYSAAESPEVRMQMNVEDEIQTSLNNRDETIKEQEQRIKEQEERLIEKDEQLSQKDEQLSQKDEQLSQKDKQINEMLATSIRLLLQNNVPVEVIAVNYGIDEAIVRRYQ